MLSKKPLIWWGEKKNTYSPLQKQLYQKSVPECAMSQNAKSTLIKIRRKYTAVCFASLFEGQKYTRTIQFRTLFILFLLKMFVDCFIERFALISINMMASILNILNIYCTLHTRLCKVTLLKHTNNKRILQGLRVAQAAVTERWP